MIQNSKKRKYLLILTLLKFLKHYAGRVSKRFCFNENTSFSGCRFQYLLFTLAGMPNNEENSRQDNKGGE